MLPSRSSCVCRVHDMRLVRQLAVLEDEVNVAAWHPYPGGGLLYGTKEGKLRLFRHDRSAHRVWEKRTVEFCFQSVANIYSGQSVLGLLTVSKGGCDTQCPSQEHTASTPQCEHDKAV